jgi:RNA polymerase-binding transcription factor DksA
MTTEDFNRLFSESATKDTGEIAKKQRDCRTAGRIELVDRERLRRVASALRRIEDGSYCTCQSCSGEISGERPETSRAEMLSG